jgi:hypothetical protein
MQNLKYVMAFLGWDEGTTTNGGGGHVPLVYVAVDARRLPFVGTVRPFQPAANDRRAWHMPALGKSSTATAVGEFFR